MDKIWNKFKFVVQISVIYIILAYQTKNIHNLPTFSIGYSKRTLCRTFHYCFYQIFNYFQIDGKYISKKDA